MNTLLIFFAFPIAVIIFSVVLEKLLKNPIIVASLIFAVFLILTFAVFGVNFLIATLAYTILSFLTAFIVHLLCRNEENEHNICDLLEDLLSNNSNNDNDNESVCDTVENLLGNSTNNNSNCGCGCNRYRKR